MLAGCDCSAMNINRPDKETFDYYFKFVGEHFYFVYPEKVSPTAETIKETFLELIIKYKIDGVVIDPFNQLYHDRKGITREDFYLEELLSDFTRFAEQNNIFFLIVAHPKGSSIVVEKDEIIENLLCMILQEVLCGRIKCTIFYFITDLNQNKT